MPNYDVLAKQYFPMINHYKKSKCLEFGIEIVNLATLVGTSKAQWPCMHFQRDCDARQNRVLSCTQ